MNYSSNPDKITRDYFDSLLLETRYIDSDVPSTKMTLFGKGFDTPVMTAALSHLHNPSDGMAIYGKGAALSNAAHWVGMGEDAELENVLATGAQSTKIIKPHADNREVFRKIEYSMDCEETAAVVLTYFYRCGGDPMYAARLGANMGGDTDTVGALAAALCGAYSGTAKLDMALIREIEQVNRVSFEEKAKSILTFISNTYNNKVN